MDDGILAREVGDRWEEEAVVIVFLHYLHLLLSSLFFAVAIL